MNDPYETVDPAPDDRNSTVDYHDPDAPPQQIGRYRVQKVLGKGGFGLVYLAYDDQLKRAVAIKVAHARLITQASDAEAYLTEARTVANLDHRNIVPVYDVGNTEGFPCFVVSKYIDGTDLFTRLKQSRLRLNEALELVATVAEALHYAHTQEIVHRDIKPGNILLDKSGKPFVADFGLALREQDVGKGPRYAGTPAYMSPEQARGEGHRVDGRSDIFSLGVVFYELLTGRRPFKGESTAELLEQVTTFEPRPPRQVDDHIPKELERICLKALTKRASERYMTAKDMADDLRHFLALASEGERPKVGFKVVDEGAVATPALGVGQTPVSNQRPVKIVPKGLRSFDAGDADFFLELLPGPRDRDGIPDSIRFWKTRIEEMDAENTFSVGLIYGPSGCGKSSLVKAGLLPRLANHVIAVYVEATADDTEVRLLKGLRKHCSDLPGNLNLVETLAALRRGHYDPAGKKVVLVLDQFEQWLHAKRGDANTELVQALRHCDGERLQCIVMVRDDFGMAATRFMGDVDIPILQGHNFATVDLFDLLHARKVLAEFGRAFGRLPDNLGKCTEEQEVFLDQAVSGLAQEGKVISVRLALFADMVKGKPWMPATLKEVGGMEGVGVTFLEDTFSSRTANPKHRLHEKAAQAVLKILLPESGTDIKGHMRSRAELLEASGYAGRPKDFDDLIRILDGEIRLITPTDPEGKEDASSAKVGEKYYQLTHDYLVPSLRDWLTRKQKETRRGRAELLLADRAAVWNARPENRQLPSLLQWFQIRWLSQEKNWTPPQRKMMRKATRYHVVRVAAVGVVLALLAIVGYEGHGRLQAHALQRSLLDANTNEVPTIVQDMALYRRWIDPLLRDAAAQAKANNDARKQLHANLALLRVDATQVDYVYGRLLDAEPLEVAVIRDALAPHKDELLDKLWAVVLTPERGKESQRLRAAAALAKYDPTSEKWTKANALVVNDLVRENAVFLGQWTEAFRSVKGHLLSPLSDIFRDRQPERAAERTLATNLLADYAADEPKVLADLLMDADEKQFAAIYPKFKEQSERGLPMLTIEIDRKTSSAAKDDVKEKLAKRQANAAVALVKMNQPDKVWPLLKHGPDPRVRSYLIHRFGPLGVGSRAIVKRLDEEPDLTIRRALILSLGDIGEKEWTAGDRKVMMERLEVIYRTAADPGLHASAEWLLRSWEQEAWLKVTIDGWAKDREHREKRLEEIKKKLAKEKEKTPPQWYVNSQGQTMVVIPGPVDFVMGSPSTEVERYVYEAQHRKRIGRTFAIAAKSVTVEQYRQFDRDYSLPAVDTRMADLPVHTTSWYQAAAYCNWLSKQENIAPNQWCYETDPEGETGPNVKVVKLRATYLRLEGYRLATEAEMEYATRAGAVTARYYGETEELLPKYAWYNKNSQDKTWPVGWLKPNDLGLFDVQGNVFTWCQESYKAYPEREADEAIDDKEDESVILPIQNRVLRGGSFTGPASIARSASRYIYASSLRNRNSGFRVARTLPVETPLPHNTPP